MRFAWLREKSANQVPVRMSTISRLIYIAYNVIWFIPIVLPLIKIIDYRTGFIAFTIVTVIRAVANLYRNNVLDPEQAESFPLRAV
jgi:hypothetical protein